MFNKFILPAVAVLGLGYAIFTVVRAQQPMPLSKPLMEPPSRPKEFRAIAGAGLIEARMENIPIGSPVAGVVWEVFVKVHDRVKKGDPLFRLDDREVRAELKVRQAMLAAAESQYHKLKAAPRPEDVPPAQAAVEEARARVGSADATLSRTANLYQRNIVPQSDYDRDRFAAAEARAALSKAQADLERLLRGTWAEDLAVAAASVDQARSQIASSQIELDRRTVRALADGEVLQVNVRPGQFAALAWKEPMIVLGDVNRLHVRADIDEQDLPYFQPGTRAVATLKGRPQVRFDLEFVKVEPYVIPKRNLTGDNAERVDTRVLQVIYALPDKRPIDLYVGQQMDVYIEAAKPPKDLSLDADPKARKPFDDEPEAPKAKVTRKERVASRS